MWRRLVAGLLVAAFWSGTAVAWGGSACACGGEGQRPIGGINPWASEAVRSQVSVYRKTVTDHQLSVQQLRNAQLQEQVFHAQIRAANRAYQKDTVLLVTALGGTVIAGGAWLVREWGEYCEHVESDGHTTLVCPF